MLDENQAICYNLKAMADSVSDGLQHCLILFFTADLLMVPKAELQQGDLMCSSWERTFGLEFASFCSIVASKIIFSVFNFFLSCYVFIFACV